MTATLFVGRRYHLDRWMHEQGLNPTEHGRTVFWAQNGPQHLHRARGRITVIVTSDPSYEITDEDRRCMQKAEQFNYEEDRK